MRIYISYPLTDDPCGGGNQFLRNLKNQFLELGFFTSSAEGADVILYNGHHNIEKTLDLKKRFLNKKTFIHRMDGLQQLYNSKDDQRQDASILFNSISNGTIFQSNWAKNKFKDYGFNPRVSKVNTEHTKIESRKTRLLCTSFSPNINKGFEFYKLLDKSLDFNKFDFTFVGNKPEHIKYKNIKCLPPETTSQISTRLKQSDIFISATVHDCCSNSIIESLSCGIPVLAEDSGGNPELVKNGGLTFKGLGDFTIKLDKISSNLDFFKKNITINNMENVSLKYISFFKKCINSQ